MKQNKLSTQPYRGTRDFFPPDLKKRNYIFNTWRSVLNSYGYEEYDAPLIEPFELYAAKTGDEIVNNQLYNFTDRGGREVAIRPEMTPSVSRMAAETYKTYPKPIKWFSIGNFWRYEKPQKGRLREFYQLNVDIFGADGITAELEILAINNSIMEAFGAKPNMYEIRINDRNLAEYFFKSAGVTQEQAPMVGRIIDNKDKVSTEAFENALKKTGITSDQIQQLDKSFTLSLKDLKDTPAARNLIQLFDLLQSAKIAENVKFTPTIVRGFDYYDGIVFEQFDLTPDNTRSMFGGGRYNGLISLFSDKNVPAVGFAPGDIPTQLFLESWDLMPSFSQDTEYLVTVFPSNSDYKYFAESQKAANRLRSEGKNAELFLDTNTPITKQLNYANKKSIKNAVIIGDEEIKTGKYTIKELK